MNFMNMHFTQWHWLGLALIFIVLEVLGGGGFLLWTGISAAIVSLIVWLIPALSWPYQFLLFAIFSVLSAYLWWRHLKKSPLTSDKKQQLNQRAQQYVGRIFTLEEAMVNHQGWVKIDGTLWRIQGEEDLPIGTTVVVLDTSGIMLTIKKQ